MLVLDAHTHIASAPRMHTPAAVIAVSCASCRRCHEIAAAATEICRMTGLRIALLLLLLKRSHHVCMPWLRMETFGGVFGGVNEGESSTRRRPPPTTPHAANATALTTRVVTRAVDTTARGGGILPHARRQPSTSTPVPYRQQDQAPHHRRPARREWRSNQTPRQQPRTTPFS